MMGVYSRWDTRCGHRTRLGMCDLPKGHPHDHSETLFCTRGDKRESLSLTPRSERVPEERL